MKTQTVVLVNSHNLQNILFTFEAYCELRCLMTSEDLSSHVHRVVEVDSNALVITKDDVYVEQDEVA